MLETVLCVDDDPITLMLCKKVIMKSNLSKNIYSAINGEDALKFFDNLINKQDILTGIRKEFSKEGKVI